MNYLSVRGQSAPVGFREALVAGLAPDGGLYVPRFIPKLRRDILENLPDKSLHDLGREIAQLFIDDIPNDDLNRIVQEAWNFSIPLKQLDDRIWLLELFHGPTLAFKDIGARFMAHVLSHYLRRESRQLSIMVATSGDTGSAVAHGFFNVPNINVYVLYPSGKISRLQEQQMTTLGGNIHAVEVEGTFDDCQKLVKQSLSDARLRKRKFLTTANSINLGRLIPQTAYYAWAVAQYQRMVGRKEPLTFVVPSGNLGNLTAAIYARGMGIPILRFVAATNINDGFPNYLRTGVNASRTSIQTLSNAMDVGDPSNFARILAFYKHDWPKMRSEIEGVSITDDRTLAEMKLTYEKTKYVLDPHTAVGVEAARDAIKNGARDGMFIVAATAHPAKFPDTVLKSIGRNVEIPQQLLQAMQKPKRSTRIPASIDQLTDILMR